MKSPTWWLTLVRALGTVALSHVLAYILMRFLPDAAITALGLAGTNHEVAAAFLQQHAARSYAQVVTQMLSFDFGVTLDGVAVQTELMSALAASLPRFLLSMAGMLCLAVILPIKIVHLSRLNSGVLPFFSFLPAYVLPLVALGGLATLTFIFGLHPAPMLNEFVLCLVLLIPSSSLALAQAGSVMKKLLTTDFVRTMHALGVAPQALRQFLLFNLMYELLPSIQKLTVALLGVLLFVEPMFGVPGLGTTAMRAIRRSDLDLLLGLVFVFATLTVAIGLIGQFFHLRLQRIE